MDSTYLKSANRSEGRSYNEASVSLEKTALVRNILYITYIIIPIAAGADKFFNILTVWENYLNPMMVNILPVKANVFMMLVGVIEMAAGVLVLLRPKIGAYVVTLWLVLIALQLLAGWMFPDIAVRDLAMAAGAFCLANLYSETK